MQTEKVMSVSVVSFACWNTNQTDGFGSLFEGIKKLKNIKLNMGNWQWEFLKNSVNSKVFFYRQIRVEIGSMRLVASNLGEWQTSKSKNALITLL